ncbi:MAG: BMP family ABC transporter substrate-binding protein [Oscillospiraceae bacterium]|nr:BMP family ABC transporter substrate-binding protein [Oscillospiraceae bacterium]
MKKFLALMLALVMVLSLAACGGNTNTETTEPVTDGGEEVAEVAMKVAMITDYGDITDQSFNQTTYEAAKAWSEANGVEFNYFKPASDSDDDRVAMIEKAIDEGFNVIVMPGYAFAAAIAKTAPEYSDVTFVALDVSEYDLTTAGLATLPANLYSAVYQEELAGYMAGYAAVKLGYTKLGFLGGMAVPAVQRYGYGFVQGADAAAAADGKTDVAIKYAYGNQFYGDADITAAMDTWYADGVEVVFACGGGIFTSAGEAAAKVEGAKVIGVDVDQAATIDGLYGEGMTVTSAMKGLAATVNTLLTQVKDGSFQGGRVENLGLVSADVEANYVQLPVASTQWNDTFAQADYEALVASMFAGDITVDNDITKAAGDFATVVALEDLGNIK